MDLIDAWNKLNKLKDLNLANNKLKTIGRKIFVNCGRSVNLNLQNNQLEEIDIELKLSTVQISNNSISSIKKLNSDTIDLNFNNIVEFNSSAFNGNER